MNKIFTFLTVFLTVSIGYAQACLDPIADAEQYFCTASTNILDDLTVDSQGGTLEWYSDAATTILLPGTTTVVDGETYYVMNDCGSAAVAITVYLQSIEFVVSPSSCVNLGGNVFFIEEDDLATLVEIEVLNLDGDPFTEKVIWSPVAQNEFYAFSNAFGWFPLPATSGQNAQIPGTLVFNHIRKNDPLDPFDLLELELELPAGNSGCAPSTESITIIAGGLEYKEICYGSTQDLQDVFDYYEGEGVFNQEVTWYDAATNGNIVPATDAIAIGDVYYADFDIDGCDVRIPVKIEYKVEAPLGGGEYFFCSDTAWDLINVSITERLTDIPVGGANLKWYDANFDPILFPNNIVLVHGDIYFVTNEVNGCQSEPLQIQVTEKDCGCMVDPGINTADGFEFFTTPVEANACSMTYRPNATPISLGPVNSVAGNASRAVRVTPGMDPLLQNQGVGFDLPRTSPFATNSTGALRLNSPGAQYAITIARKDFVAGEVISMDFATVLEDPSHPLPNQPFFQVNIYDENLNIIQTRCVLADPNDCIFHDAGNDILYSDWSTIKLDTREIQGEPAMVELIAAWCEYTGHYGYTYVDNIFVGDNVDSDPNAIASFGYIEIETLDNGTHIYNDCSYMEMNENIMCEAVLPALNPDFPIQVCGVLDNPVNSLTTCVDPSLDLINLHVYKNGTNVGTVANANTTATGFCFDLDVTDITVPPYGHFALEAYALFKMNEGNPNEYEYEVAALNSGFKICPVAECVGDLTICIPAGGPLQHIFDLTVQEPIALDKYTDQSIFEISYYEDLADANAGSNPIQNPGQFLATGTHEIFLRVDYDWQSLGMTAEDNCYDLVSFEVTVSTDPELPLAPIEVEYCEIEGQVDYIFDLGLQDLRDDILAQVSGVKANYVLEFYNSSAGATAQDAADLVPTPGAHEVSIVNSPATVWVRIIAPGDCWSIFPIDLIIHEAPTLLEDTWPMVVCQDPNNPGEGVFDLPSVINNIVDPALGYDVAYFTDAALTNAVTTPATHTGSDGDIIYVEITDPSTECTSVAEITLTVVDTPVIPTLTPLALCDEGGMEADFNLGDVVPIIQGGDTTLEVDFYSSLALAQAATPGTELPLLYTSGTATVHVRANYQGANCPAFATLDLTVNPLPAIPTVPPLELCADPSGADVTFPLDSDTALITAILDGRPAADLDISFHDDQADAESGSAPITDITTGTTTSVWVRIVDTTTTPSCHNTFELDIIVHPLPTLLSHQETLTVCEGASTPGVGIFDLGLANIVDAALGYDVDYYSDAGLTNPITTPGSHSGANGDVVYVEVTDTTTGCSDVAQIDLVVTDAPPVPVLIPLEECDAGNGQAQFDLGGLIPYIQDGDSSLLVDFYATAAAANDPNLGPALPSLYTSASTTVYVRVAIPGINCFAVEELQLIVNSLPDIPVIDTIQACEDPSGADITFELTNNTNLISDILDGRAPADLTISFHSSRTSAENNTAPIDDITTGGTETVWVRLLDTNTLCENVFSIEIKVNPLPLINSPVELRICDEAGGSGLATFNLNLATSFMVGQGSNYDVTYYETQPEAEGGLPADRLSNNFTNTIAFNQTIFARIQDRTTGCHITEPVLLEVDEAPEANTPDPLVYCDPNNDGIGTFYLPDANENGAITSDLNAIVTYHRTEADARLNVLPLPDTVDNNMVNINQPIWVRVEVPGVDCYTLVQLILIVEPTPDLEDPSGPLIGCDIDGSGIFTFDLTEIVDDEVMGNILNPGDYDIAYFASETDRDNGVPIAAPSAYTSASGTVLVVVTNPTTGCSSEVEIELFVAPLPDVFQPAHMEVCDVDNPGDELEYFYLDEAVQEITGGNPSLIVTFHETQLDADNGDNALAVPYQNTHNNQTIYIRVQNEFGCVVTDTITLTLVVNPLPAPVVPPTYEVCDIDNEGFAYFDLDALKDDIIGNDPDLNISFHETYSDAEFSMNPLGSPYQNIVGGEQVIFIRAYFDDVPDGTGCFRIIEIVLKALPSPIVPVELDDLYFCAADITSSVRVNLTGYEDLIYGSQDRDELDLTYHLTPEAAANGNAPIADPTDFLLSPPSPVTIYVRLGYINGDCYNVVSFKLYLIEGPEINDPTALSVCSPIGEPNTETAVFDLLDKREEILGVGTTGLGIYFYEDEADALIGNNNYISNPTNYTNIVNPQTIYVRVVDSQENEMEDAGCVAFTTLTLRVDPNPEPGIPDPIVYCLLDNDEVSRRVDLTIRELQILNHESWDLEYYRRYRDAVNGDQFERIVSPEDYEIALEDSPLTIYVRVINPNTGCFEIVELEIILSTLPEVLPPEDIEPLIVCSTDNKEWALFDLTVKLPEIFGTQNLDGLDVFFYEDLEDAIDGVKPIIDPENYYNTSNPQIIYVGVGNPDIDDCYIGGLTWFEIKILEGAFAESPTETYKVCGMPGPDGGVGVFDLRNEDLIEDILGMQDPDFFDVDFFLTEDAAHENAAGTRLGDTYENISNPQTIYVRVTNQETGCYAIAEVVLEVIVIEELILEDLYSLCTDAQGNPMQDADGNIIYPIIDTGLDIDGYTFKWFFEGERLPGQTAPYLVADQIGTYRVEIVSLDTGCTLSLDIEVVESSMPFNYGAEVTSPAFSGTYNVEAWAEGFGDYWYAIDGGTEQDHGAFTNVGIGSHVITITDRNGCGSVDIIVNVVDYPKFFTPNDDGYNDTWNIPGMAELDPSAEIFIFDRHGKLLKQLNPLSEGWDGTFNGKALPSTDYWFVVKYMEDGAPAEFKGHFSLKR